MISKKSYEFIQEKQKTYMLVMGIVFFSMVILMVSISRWSSKRDTAVCVPLGQHAYPMISYLPVSSREQDDAKLYTFIERYIKVGFDERIVDYHRPTNNKRYTDAFLKESLLEAVEMSLGAAKEENMKKFSNSNDVARQLKACNCGWVFNIHAIESIQKTNYNGVIHVTVLGEYQVTYDNVKTDLPHKLWGFKRVWLTISQGAPTRDSKGNFKNEYGLFVTSQEIEDVPYELRDEMNQAMMIKGFYVP